ncbi:MAG: hypothetical protein Q8K63_12615, partial [Acidimicrobiales bacterium]|nr:hypothetical protein [Acidimicrobiales bacterium]
MVSLKQTRRWRPRVLTGILDGGVSPPFDGYPVNMLSGEAFDGVVTVDDHGHALRFLAGTHSAVVRVSYGLASSHVSGLDVCIDANGAAVEFRLRV